MKTAFVVLNPVAGHSRERVPSLLERHFAEVNWAWELYETTGEERVADVVRAALERSDGAIDLVVAAGGDGTVSGVAGGLVDVQIPMGIIPVGTGNALARELNIPLNVGAALDLLTGEHALAELDAMQVGERFFVLNFSVGLSSLMTYHTAREDKRRFGRVAYVWTGLMKLFGYQPHRFDVTVDGERTRWRAVEVMIANSGAIGDPSLRWSPQVKLNDGRIDVCIVRAKSVLDYLRLTWAVLLGRQRHEPHLQHLIAERDVAVNTSSHLPVQGDGDFIGWPPVAVEVVPGAVQVVVPRSGGERLVLDDLLDFVGEGNLFGLDKGEE